MICSSQLDECLESTNLVSFRLSDELDVLQHVGGYQRYSRKYHLKFSVSRGCQFTAKSMQSCGTVQEARSKGRSRPESIDLSFMERNVLFLLYVFCNMAAMAEIHLQDDAIKEVVIHDQAFEGQAVHSMMQSWLNAGTSPALFDTDGWNWYIDEHPCYENKSRQNYEIDWNGIDCSTVAYVPEDNNRVQYHTLVGLDLSVYRAPRPLFGELPLEVTSLINLEHLLISDASELTGPLPAGLFCFSRVLRSIILSNCSFNGSISNGFGPSCGPKVGPSNPLPLEHLDLSRNSFTEMSPISWTDNTILYFTNLQYLNVSNNQIRGEFAIWSNFLEIVDISNNFITIITSLGETSKLNSSLKSIYAQNNSINKFPIQIFEYETLQDIYLDSNQISSIVQKISNARVSTLQKISMSKNIFQVFPEGLLQLPNLEEIILDSNNIQGELHLPNISCQDSKIKLISLLYNNITHFYPSNDPTSCFSETSLLLDAKVFLYENPICKYQRHKSKLLRFICRMGATFPIEAEELTSVKTSNKILWIIVACVSIVVIAISIVGFLVIQKLKKKISLLHEIQNEFDKREVKPYLYSFGELKVATQNFNIRNELGRGGFGVVYKGTLSDGSCVAVKKLTKSSMEQGIQDFLSEIVIVSNIKHRNLVQLKGCCIRENQRILVHEYVENKNLKDALWGDSRKLGHLNWPTRFNIILGIAQGLAYLHEGVQPAIVHRDIKGENILLDKHFNPKIADFGLALFFPSFDDGETHMSVSKVAGTRGYMAPEYFCYGQVSTKLDVFSFGVLLLEIVSGRKMIDLKSSSTEQYLVQWAQGLHSSDNLPIIKDKSLKDMTLVDEATFKQVVKVGLLCLHHIAARRPTMSEVVAMLIGNKNVDDCALRYYHEDTSSSYDIGSSSFCISIPNLSLQSIREDDNSLHLDCESHKQSLQLCEIGLLSK